MYKSKEIRWFTRENNHAIIEWFSIHGITSSNILPRTDFYLPFPGKEDISIKLREGNIEIKRRQGPAELFQLSENAAGYLENWVKWSFNIDKSDLSEHEIIEGKRQDWLPIYKERLGMKIELKDDGEWLIHGLEKKLASGCQLEYTSLTIGSMRWYTFAVEWFGEECITLEREKFPNVMGNYRLDQSASLSYNAFITRLVSEGAL